ncbi:polyadenylate-binding protein-interacting protein 2-like [Asterias rubens]|uniref:polyadenylate-binding protein-interacting protein 2-like n=1 Tax=Asterias rubens TaxID=7604 RepID=UPI0014556C42|nr:polyadenylate-binding protein-interacting protein 2-like [Asterias rubens]
MEEGNPDSNSTQKDILIPATRNEDDINPFEEYMWMGDPKEEDEVNQQIMEEILEEEFIESCFEDMLEEEALGLFSPPNADGDTIDDGIPSLHSLSIDSGAISDLDADGVVAGESGIVEEQDITWRGTAEGVAPSGFGGHDSEGESDNSDSDSLGDNPQR